MPQRARKFPWAILFLSQLRSSTGSFCCLFPFFRATIVFPHEKTCKSSQTLLLQTAAPNNPSNSTGLGAEPYFCQAAEDERSSGLQPAPTNSLWPDKTPFKYQPNLGLIGLSYTWRFEQKMSIQTPMHLLQQEHREGDRTRYPVLLELMSKVCCRNIPSPSKQRQAPCGFTIVGVSGALR